MSDDPVGALEARLNVNRHSRVRPWMVVASVSWVVVAVPLALLTISAYTVDSRLADHARTTTAVITSVGDESADGDYTWKYEVLGATCTGSNSDRNPFPQVGTRIVIYYSVLNPCDSLDYNPEDRRWNDSLILGGATVLMPLAAAGIFGAAAAFRRSPRH